MRFQRETRRIAAISGDFRRDLAKFLCDPDCVAEREGFEPSVQVSGSKPRGVRKLQIVQLQQRILRKNERFNFCDQSGFTSLFHPS